MSADDHLTLLGQIVPLENTLTLRYRWTVDDLLEAHRYHFRHTCRPALRLALNGLFLMALIGGAIDLLQDGDGVAQCLSLASVCIGVYGLVYGFVLGPFERRWMIRRRFATRPDRDQEIEWQIAPEGIRIGSSIGRSECGWQAFSKVVRTPKGLMFYPNDQVFHWVPRRVFSDDAEFDAVAELAKAKASKFFVVG